MSTGDRLQLDRARSAAECLMKLWKMQPDRCFIVGSIRRQRPTVGDLEIIAPLRAKTDDDIYHNIAATLNLGGLFATQNNVGVAIEGFRPGFKACSLKCDVNDGATDFSLPVQIFRYTPENYGWMKLMRTGPGDFGQLFLHLWKVAHGINKEKPASIDGHLVDATGAIVPVHTEEDCFRRIGRQFTPPEKRDELIEKLKERQR